MLILCFGACEVISGTLTLGGMLAFQLLMSSFMSAFGEVVMSGSSIQSLKGGLERIEDVFKYPTRSPFATDVSERAETEKAASASCATLELRNIVFGYNRTEPPTIDGLSLKLDAGRRIALVGASGSGKSTIAKIAVGLLEPWSGEVLVDGKPLLAFRKETLAPVVLIFSERGNVIFDAATGHTETLDAHSAENLDDVAFRFYRLFLERQLGAKDLLKFIFADVRPFLFVILGIGIITGIISLVMPLATEYVTGKIIPSANETELNQILVLLVVFTICNTAFGLVPKIAALVFGSKMLEQTQVAVFDRLLKAPLKIFQTCDSADLATRALGIVAIQETIFGVVSKQFFSSVCSLLSCVMMFYYSVKLALVGIVCVLIYSAAIILFARMNLRWQARHAEKTGAIAGLLKQFIDGFATVRTADAEGRVASKYFDGFSDATEAQYKIERTGAVQGVLAVAFPLVVSLLFFVCVGGVWKGTLGAAAFLAFTSAFQNFQSGVLGVADGVCQCLGIVPEIRRAVYILNTEVECAAGKNVPEKLDGSVEISHVSFRYAPDAPLALDNVSLRVEPGEFVAIVGASGAGKSSLVRLLLGFDSPESGAVLYGGQDLAATDVRAVRRMLGVILQNSSVVPGSILDNIVTGTEFTLSDAWRALELAAIREEVESLFLFTRRFRFGRGKLSKTCLREIFLTFSW